RSPDAAPARRSPRRRNGRVGGREPGLFQERRRGRRGRTRPRQEGRPARGHGDPIVGRARARQCEAGGTRVDLLALPSHLAISRARLFLDLADECTMEQRDRCEAFMEAAIIFCRTALQRARTQYKRRPSWNDWWDRLRTDPNLAFTRQRRNWIVKEAPETFSQGIRAGQPFSFVPDY